MACVLGLTAVIFAGELGVAEANESPSVPALVNVTSTASPPPL